MQSLRLLREGPLRPLLSSKSRIAQSAFHPLRSNTQSTFRTRPTGRTYSSFTSHPSPLRARIKSHGASKSFRRFESTQSAANDANLSLSQRLRKLSREYGWSALGVYLALSALDFPFCFLAVNMLGTDRIGEWEHAVMSYVQAWVKWPLPTEGQEMVDGAVNEVKGYVKQVVPLDEVRDGEKRILEEDQTIVADGHGYKQAEKANRGVNASLWTQLALAYAIHKSFIFLRVPLTAAVLPKVVKTLRSWGWNIGKRPAKKVAASTGVNTGTTGVKPPGT